MNKYFNTLTNTRGDSLPGFRAQVVDSLGAIVSIYQDRSLTPFTDASNNPVNYATADADGLAQFFWNAADGQILQILDTAGNLVNAIDGFADNFVLDNLPGEVAQEAVSGLPADLSARPTFATLSSSGGAALIGFQQSGAGAVARTAEAKGREVVSAKDFGAVGDGVTNDGPAISAALATGRSVYLPNGVYRTNTPLIMAQTGQRLFGESAHNAYITSAPGATHDIVRIAASDCEVDHLHMQPGGTSGGWPLRVFAARARVHHCRFLSLTNNAGVAIWLDDENPANPGVPVAGAYTHRIHDNTFGADGYAFNYGIYCHSLTNGQQANVIRDNYFIGNSPIYVTKGGANTYCGNLFQSSTGTSGTPAGTAIDLQPDVVNERIFSNYFERYIDGIKTTRSSNALLIFTARDNEYEYVTNHINSAAGATQYLSEDGNSATERRLGWRRDRGAASEIGYTPSGTEFYRATASTGTFEPVLTARPRQTLSYTADGQTRTPTNSWCEITGSGAARTGCFLGNGVRAGQDLFLRGYTWPVTINNNPGGTQNIVFAGNAASATFGGSDGGGAGEVFAMHLIWDAAYGSGRWFEMSRSVR